MDSATAVDASAPPPTPRSAEPSLTDGWSAPLPDEAAAQRRQLLLDADRRATAGIYIYLPVWLGTVLALGLETSEPVASAAIALVWLGLGAGRWWLHRHLATLVLTHEAQARRLFHVLLLGSGVATSLLCAVALFWPPLRPARDFFLLLCGITCASATMTLAIDPVLRYGLPAAYLLPLAVGLALRPDEPVAVMLLPAVLMAVYLARASRHVHDDYWHAVQARADLQRRASALEQLSITDALTQIHNRLYFELRLTQEWSLAARERRPLALLIIDLDHFKRINDVHGHAFGDHCLQATAAALRRSAFRPADTVARYGGEEFVMLLPNTDIGPARLIAERARLAVAGLALQRSGQPVMLSCSIGLSCTVPAPDGTGSRGAMSRADEALYAAKAAGRNRVVAAHPADTQPAAAHHAA